MAFFFYFTFSKMLEVSTPKEEDNKQITHVINLYVMLVKGWYLYLDR